MSFISARGKHRTHNQSQHSVTSTAQKKETGRKASRNILLWILLIILITTFVVSITVVLYRLINLKRNMSDLDHLIEVVENYTQPNVNPSESMAEATSSDESFTDPSDDPMTPEKNELIQRYAPLAEMNPDFCGWLSIDGTSINYPIMHTPTDPEKYLHLNFNEDYSILGLPFLDGKCNLDSSQLILYGHNMRNGAMFGELLNYTDEAFWKEHQFISFDTLYEERIYEVIAVFYDRVYYQHEDCYKFYEFIEGDEEDVLDALLHYKSKSLYDTGFEVEGDGQLIALTTCSYHTDDGRFVVIGQRKE